MRRWGPSFAGTSRGAGGRPCSRRARSSPVPPQRQRQQQQQQILCPSEPCSASTAGPPTAQAGSSSASTKGSRWRSCCGVGRWTSTPLSPLSPRPPPAEAGEEALRRRRCLRGRWSRSPVLPLPPSSPFLLLLLLLVLLLLLLLPLLLLLKRTEKPVNCKRKTYR